LCNLNLSQGTLTLSILAASPFQLREQAEGFLQLSQNSTISADELRAEVASMVKTILALVQTKYEALTCAELDSGNFDLEYLVDGILVAGQPCIMAGPQKSLKTSLLVDLGISLATGGHFLGYFPILRPVRVTLMTGESGLGTIQETTRRIAYKAGKQLAEIDGFLFSEHLSRVG
jgi:hypothetical protein